MRKSLLTILTVAAIIALPMVSSGYTESRRIRYTGESDIDVGAIWKIKGNTLIRAGSAPIMSNATLRLYLEHIETLDDMIVADVLTVNGSLVMEGDFVGAEGDKLVNEVQGDWDVLFTNETANLGTLAIKSGVASNNIADNDILEQVFEAPDSLNNVTLYGEFECQITDFTTATEDSRLTFKYFDAGSSVSGLIMGADASGVQSATMVPPLTISDSTDASTKDTGSLIVEGGIGIELALFVGTTATFTGNSTHNGNIIGDASTVVTNMDIFYAETAFEGPIGVAVPASAVFTTIDGNSLTVDAAGAGVDAQSAGKLNIGTATADAIDIGKTTEIITLLGPVNTDEAVTMDTTLGVTGNATFNGDIFGDASTVVSNIAALWMGDDDGESVVFTNVFNAVTNVITTTGGALTTFTTL